MVGYLKVRLDPLKNTAASLCERICLSQSVARPAAATTTFHPRTCLLKEKTRKMWRDRRTDTPPPGGGIDPAT